MLSTETKEFIRQEIKEELNERDHQLNIRLVRIEEELKHQRELIKINMDNTNKRFDGMVKLISIGFVVLATLITVFKFIN